METTVIVAIISATALILVQIVGHYFSRWKESEADWRKNKFEQYRQFLTALSSIVGSDSTPEGHREFAMACNTLHLIASERAIKALHKFRDEIAISNSKNRTQDKHDALLAKLVWELRVDLGLRRESGFQEFSVRLWESGIRSKPEIKG